MVVIQAQLMDVNFKARHRSMSHKSVTPDFDHTEQAMTALDEIEILQQDELAAFQRQYQGSQYQKGRDQIAIDVKRGSRPVSVRVRGQGEGSVSVALPQDLVPDENLQNRAADEEEAKEQPTEEQSGWRRFTSYISDKLCGTGEKPAQNTAENPQKDGAEPKEQLKAMVSDLDIKRMSV